MNYCVIDQANESQRNCDGVDPLKKEKQVKVRRGFITKRSTGID